MNVGFIIKGTAEVRSRLIFKYEVLRHVRVELKVALIPKRLGTGANWLQRAQRYSPWRFAEAGEAILT